MYLSFWCFILLSPLAVRAQADAYFSPDLKTAHTYITQLRFLEAGDIIAKERSLHPENKVSSYLEAAMLCAELFVNEDQKHYSGSEEKIDELISEIEEIPADNPFRNLFLGELYVAQATLNGKFKNNFKAAWQFYKAYNLLTSNYEQFPDFMPTYIPLGVLYAAIGSLPDDYRSMASMLGFEGSVQKGMHMLKKSFWRVSADEDLRFYRPYAGFVYSYVSYMLAAEEVVSPEELSLDVANSSFLIYAQVQIDLNKGKAKKALKLLDQRPEGKQYLKFNYLDYQQGKILLGLDPDRSVDYFNSYLQNNSSQVYIKSTYRYLSWHYLLQGNSQKAEEMRQKIFLYGNTHTGADRQALLEARRGFNKTLIQARVLFDVGRYEEAEQTLRAQNISVCCNTPNEKAEYYYRYGRIKEQLNEQEEAIGYFIKALAVPNAGSSYSLGNSALQIAAIMEDRNDVEQAKLYYRKALKFAGYPFYEGIHQKAKSGLARL